MVRFVSSPFIFTVETDYHNWSYSRPAFTICADYENLTFVEEVYHQSQNKWSKQGNRTFQEFRYYMNVIGSMNAETVDQFNQFENIPLFEDLQGEDLLEIATNV